MRLVVQRVRGAAVRVRGETIAQIDQGLLILVGVGREDRVVDADLLAEKCVHLRIFADEADKMNRSVLDVGGAALVISQFTLYGDCRRGRRPDFVDAARPETARPLFEQFVATLRAHGLPVQTGAFGAKMEVSMTNDGPVTLILSSADLQRGKHQAKMT
jgi:D-tyrosyl-tRNA(Tyr) deacylase